MAQPLCAASDFTGLSKCLQQPCMSSQRRSAIRAYAMILELQARGGTDYRTNFQQLLKDVSKFLPMSKIQIDAALTEVYLENAAAAGATVPALNAIVAAAIKLQNARYLPLLELFLRCRLGSAH